MDDEHEFIITRGTSIWQNLFPNKLLRLKAKNDLVARAEGIADYKLRFRDDKWPSPGFVDTQFSAQWAPGGSQYGEEATLL